MKNWSPRLGDGYGGVYMPRSRRSPNWFRIAALALAGICFAMALYYVLPIAMVIMKALGEMLQGSR